MNTSNATQPITATLSMIHWHPRRACLEIDGPNMFIGASIEIGQQYGGAFASKQFIADALMKVAQDRVNFEAKTHGFPAPIVAWEA